MPRGGARTGARNWGLAGSCANHVAGNIKPSKRKSTEKIDGAVAMVMGLATVCSGNQQMSIYDQRDRWCCKISRCILRINTV